MLIDLLEISGVAFSVFSAGGIGVFRFKNRKRRSPEWRQQRLAHFMLNVELESSCERLGHVMFMDGSGCMYCDDLIKVGVHWYGDRNDPYHLMSLLKETEAYDGFDYIFIDPSTDKRIVEVVCTKEEGNHVNSRLGYVMIDPNVDFTPERYNTKHTNVTNLIEKHFNESKGLRMALDSTLDTRYY